MQPTVEYKHVTRRPLIDHGRVRGIVYYK